MSGIRTEIIDGVGFATLNRPRAINALNLEMITSLYETLSKWIIDEEVESIELQGEGDRGFCAGADVRELRQTILDGGDWLGFLELEYALDNLIAESHVPITSHMRGITMGGGLGLTAHSRRRLVYSDTTMAMPETRIGLFPDCALLYQLSRGGAVGTHLALTSASFTGGDAIRLDIADESPDGELPAPLFDAEWIQECYEGDDLLEIVHRLETHAHPAAQDAARELRARSPFAAHITLRALRRAETLERHEVFAQDLALAAGTIPIDFVEGVRARLVDKDNDPQWRWKTLEEVPQSAVDTVFQY